MSLIGEARIPNRNAKLCETIRQMYASGNLAFSFEIMASVVSEVNGTMVIDAAEGNELIGMAIVSVPAYPEAKALKLIAEEQKEEDLFEIIPAIKYTDADLNWRNENSRTSLEMKNPASRPAVASIRDNMDEYDTLFVGFPIWWYVAPTIINTFMEQYNLAGKTIIPFSTSGGSGMGKTNEMLSASCPGATLLEGRVFKSDASLSELDQWGSQI